jgi:ubiquinone/menaquinone biosynthesis C-methylase UbiE
MEAYQDPKRRGRILSSRDRRGWLRADDAIKEKCGVRPGMTCIDLGCGAGAFSFPLAEAVGEKGKVYAVDNNADVLNIINEKIPPQNLVTVNADVRHTGLDGAIADLCLMVLILHEVEPPEEVMAEAYRLLKPGGKTMVLEWRMDFDSPHPPRDERIGKERMERLFAGAGFTSSDYTEWSNSHYIATAMK